MIRVIILCILGISASAEVTNYCDLPDSVCPSKLQHIACDNNGDFSPKCGIDSIFEALSDTQKNKILVEQNIYRNLVANGISPYLIQKRWPMVTLQWDDELAGIAQYIANTCEQTLDKCYNTCRFPHSKQFVKNYAYNSKESYLANILKGIHYLADNWISAPIPDFILMITDHHTHVGCAAVVYGTEEKKNMQLVCNYGSSRTSCFNVRNSDFLYLCNPEKSVFEKLC